jgi:pyruvate formate lyase activating enzyme
MSKIICEICPHHCALAEGQTGLCGARRNTGDSVTAINYGLVTSIALDPIEKKPLYIFYPNSTILSVGSFGCNFRCSFCQNYEISTADLDSACTQHISPEKLVELALSLRDRGNIGIAYTYNEPLVGYEYVRDCAEQAKAAGLKNVVVSNGYICHEPLVKILPLIDAFNIDLKAFNDGFYRKIGGDLETVKHSIETVAEYCQLEITTLVIPGENDSEQEIIDAAKWIASIDPNIPLHLTRFYPRYKMLDKDPTHIDKIQQLAKLARKYLNNVYPRG